MKNTDKGVFISNKKSEEFYNSLTTQEKKVMNKMTNNMMKSYFDRQQELQKDMKLKYIEFLKNNGNK